MPIINGCCCFDSLETGSRRVAIFTWVTAICNIAIDISALVQMHHAYRTMVYQEFWLYFPPGIIPLIYIELAMSVGLVVLGVLLLIGINQGQHGWSYLFAWMIGVIIDRIYDVFLGVYILIWIGGHRFDDVLFVIPESIVVTIYWLLNSFILIAALICVISYWQELMDDIYGKEKRIKYYSKMSNIRAAALSGVQTPYRSVYGSRSTIMMSHGSLNPAYVHKY